MESLWGYHIGTSIVNFAASIDIRTVGLIEQLTGEGILFIVYQVINSHQDNVILWNAILSE
jgi:hypothetical protein